MDSRSQGENPFVDPVLSDPPPSSIEETTLIVGRTASLTLGTDSLIVLGKSQYGIEISELTRLASR